MDIIKFDRTATKRGGSLHITLPFEICKHLKIKDGDPLSVFVERGKIVVEKKEE